MRYISTCLLALTLVLSAEQKPNIIIIFTDDQGYNDLGCFGSENIKTPNIDQMAKEGMRLKDFYSAASVCTPSRAALLTGCYPDRVGPTGVLFPQNETAGLNPAETTIAEMLKAQGYATACIGKWHLGHHTSVLPTSQGFDLYYGIPYSNDMTIAKNMKLSDKLLLREGVTNETIWDQHKHWVPLMRGEEVTEYPADQNSLTKRFTQEAISFIKANQDKPFFVYLPHTMPHVPLYASPEFQGKSEAGLYGDCVEEIDWSVGQILATLKTLGIDNNTLVVYTSDNGPWKFPANKSAKVKGDMNRRVGGSAFPLRGYKFQTWEGGMRVPAVMRWPGRIPAGTDCSEVTGTIDLLPTIAEVTGADLPDVKIDGKSIVPLIEGKEGAVSPHEAYYYRTNAVRMGKWKLIHEKKAGTALYDLSVDIAETKDLSKEHPEMVEKLSAMLDAHAKELSDNQRHGRK